MRILLVEDSLRLQASIGKALRMSGYAVDISGDGEGGLWLAESNDYDAVILDIMLPDSDGLDICKGIRNDADLAQTPIIFLTARASEYVGLNSWEVRKVDYLRLVDSLCEHGHANGNGG